MDKKDKAKKEKTEEKEKEEKEDKPVSNKKKSQETKMDEPSTADILPLHSKGPYYSFDPPMLQWLQKASRTQMERMIIADLWFVVERKGKEHWAATGK